MSDRVLPREDGQDSGEDEDGEENHGAAEGAAGEGCEDGALPSGEAQTGRQDQAAKEGAQVMDERRQQRRMAMRGVTERLALSFASGGVEMRAKPNGTGAGSNFEWNGYAAVYDTPFDMWDPFGDPYTESVAPGACKRSLANPALDVPFLVGHNDAGVPLARTKSGTMQLSEDGRGLHVHVPAMDGRREEVRALASAVERGDLDEMSLAFVCQRQEWDPGFEHRTVAEMDIHRGDVCAVVHGANPATAGASMFPVEQLSFRRPAAIGAPVVLFELLSVTQAERDKAKAAGNSLPDGSYPINNTTQLHSAAVLAASHHGDWKAAQALIRRRAKELGVDVSTLPGFGEEKAADGPYELRASGAEDFDLSQASDYDAGAADHPFDGTHAHPHTDGNGGTHDHAHDHAGDGNHGHGHDSAGQGANVVVDDSTGIPGDETQFAAANPKREQLRQELVKLFEFEALVS